MKWSCNMKKTLCLAVSVTFASSLAGCANNEFAQLNQKVSDIAYSMNDVLYGGQVTRSTQSKHFIVNVDVDTAAARLRNYYRFIDVQAERARLNSPGVVNAGLHGAILEQNRHKYAATPGSYYHMARNVGKKDPADHLDIVLSKEGAQQTSITVKHESSFKNQQTTEYRDQVFNNVQEVALGNKRP